MKNPFVILASTVLLSAVFAGCVGDVFGPSAPEAIVSVTEVAGKEHTLQFDGSESKGKGLSYNWEFGDGTNSTKARVEHTYSYPNGEYTARLVITDKEGAMDVWEQSFQVGGENSPPVAAFSLPKRQYMLNEAVRVDASASTDADDDPLVYRWDFNNLMSRKEYEAFKAEKAGDDDADGGNGSDGNDDGNETALMTAQGTPAGPEPVAQPEVPRLPDLTGTKHAGHGAEGEPPKSTFSHIAETDEPVYVMQGGYPEETDFYISLKVYDIKGGHEEIVSEEIWALRVSDDPPSPLVKGGASGDLDIGIPASIEEEHEQTAGSLGLYKYEDEVTFELLWPLAPSARTDAGFAPTGRINLTWTAEHEDPLEGAQLKMELITPSGQSFSGTAGGSSSGPPPLFIELDGRNDYVDGNWEAPWKIKITARSGADISWTLDWWMLLDTNPFKIDEEGEE